jgi:predicted neuraminidase
VWFDVTLDWGETWHKMGPVAMLRPHVYDTIQPTLFFVRDGKNQSKPIIRALIRSSSGYILTTVSRDLGDTWAPLQFTDLPNPDSGIDAVRVQADGSILLAYNPTNSSRTILAIARNNDGTGDRFQQVLVLENDPKCDQFSYPSIIEDHSGLVHVIHTWICRYKDPLARISHVILKP